MTGEFSIYHWLVFIAIALILFGPSRLPQLGQSLGKAIRGFKDSLNTGTQGEETQSQAKIAEKKDSNV